MVNRQDGRNKDNSINRQRWFIDNGSKPIPETLKKHAEQARDFRAGRK